MPNGAPAAMAASPPAWARNFRRFANDRWRLVMAASLFEGRNSGGGADLYAALWYLVNLRFAGQVGTCKSNANSGFPTRRGRPARTSARSLPARRSTPYTKSLYDPHMRRTRASAPWMRFALAVALSLGLAVMSGAAQKVRILTNGRN